MTLAINPTAYDFDYNDAVIVWSVNDEDLGTLSATSNTGATVTGVGAGSLVVTAEIKYYLPNGGALTSFSPAVKDTFAITVETA